jgi:hypothetical protein
VKSHDEEGLPEETIRQAFERIRDRQRGDEGSMACQHTAGHADTPVTGDQAGSSH